MIKNAVRVRSLRPAFAPVGEEREVDKFEAAALVIMGNAEIIQPDRKPEPEPGTYLRSDLEAAPRHGPIRKNRQ